MKFKASLRDPRTFAAICQTQRNFSRKLVIKLHSDRLRFITTTGVVDGTQVWSSCRTDALCSDLILESKLDNAIYLEVIDISQLCQALKTAERSVNASVRLTRVENKQMLKVSMQTLPEQHDVSHDVAIRVLSEADVANIVAPALEERAMLVVLPPLQDLASFVERTRSAGCVAISFRASVGQQTKPAGSAAAPADTTTCQLTVAAESLHSSYRMTYDHAELLKRKKRSDPTGDNDHDTAPALQEAEVMVDMKKFSRFLSVKSVCPSKVVAHVVADKALVLSAYAIGETNLVYYMPALYQR